MLRHPMFQELSFVVKNNKFKPELRRELARKKVIKCFLNLGHTISGVNNRWSFSFALIAHTVLIYLRSISGLNLWWNLNWCHFCSFTGDSAFRQYVLWHSLFRTRGRGGRKHPLHSHLSRKFQVPGSCHGHAQSLPPETSGWSEDAS
jgi:hypothetical protein